MVAKNVVADLTKGEKLVGTNYDIWHRKIQYLLNEQELLEPLEALMDEPDLGRDGTTTAQHTARVRSYESWFKKDRSVHFTMLSNVHDDLIGEYEGYSTAKEMWDQRKFSFDGISTTRLRSLVLKFKVYKVNPKPMYLNILGKCPA